MTVMERVRSLFRGAAPILPHVPAHPDIVGDLPLRRWEATTAAAERIAEARKTTEGITLGHGFSMDADDYQYRRLTGSARRPEMARRDLSPLQQDKMLEISWFLWEQNPFAHRLITLMTDLILSNDVQIQAKDERAQEVINRAWKNPMNKLAEQLGRFHNSLSLNGELIFPVAVNPVNGLPRLGFLDPWQVQDVVPIEGNVLIPDYVLLKPAGNGDAIGRKLSVVKENPVTGELEGECFYYGINSLPNSGRGRSDLLPLADWLDLYDQYMFSEVERLHLLSSFVWDYQIDGADETKIATKLKAFPQPKPGTVFAHNEKEKLEARTPELNASDRSEVARMLRVHIAGNMGFPISYFGDIDSNKSTIDGQNDVMMRTPARRQKDFAGLLNTIVRFSVEQAVRHNRALFRNLDDGWTTQMPEIMPKDVSRVATALASVATAMDTGVNNRTLSKRIATVTQAAIIQQLGVEADPNEIQADAEGDEQKAMEKMDDMQAKMGARGLGPDGRPNPGPGGGDDNEDEDDPAGSRRLDERA